MTLQEIPLQLESASHDAFAVALELLPLKLALLLPGQAMWFFLGPQPEEHGFSAENMRGGTTSSQEKPASIIVTRIKHVNQLQPTPTLEQHRIQYASKSSSQKFYPCAWLD